MSPCRDVDDFTDDDFSLKCNVDRIQTEDIQEETSLQSGTSLVFFCNATVTVFPAIGPMYIYFLSNAFANVLYFYFTWFYFLNCMVEIFQTVQKKQYNLYIYIYMTQQLLCFMRQPEMSRIHLIESEQVDRQIDKQTLKSHRHKAHQTHTTVFLELIN